MLSIDPENRPSVSELLELHYINMRLKERKIREDHAVIKLKEEELKKKEDHLKEK